MVKRQQTHCCWRRRCREVCGKFFLYFFSRFGKVINFETGTEIGEIVGMAKAINAIDMKPTTPLRLSAGSEDFTVAFFEGPPFKFKKSLKARYF